MIDSHNFIYIRDKQGVVHILNHESPTVANTKCGKDVTEISQRVAFAHAAPQELNICDDCKRVAKQQQQQT